MDGSRSSGDYTSPDVSSETTAHRDRQQQSLLVERLKNQAFELLQECRSENFTRYVLEAQIYFTIRSRRQDTTDEERYWCSQTYGKILTPLVMLQKAGIDFFHGRSIVELTLQDWQTILDELEQFRESTLAANPTSKASWLMGYFKALYSKLVG